MYTESKDAAAGCVSFLTNNRFNAEVRSSWIPHAAALDDRIKLATYPGFPDVDDIYASMAYMKSIHTKPQLPHFDNDTAHIRDLIDRGLPVPKTALVAIDPAGYYIELFEGGRHVVMHGDDVGAQNIIHHGQLFFVPYGYCLIIPSYVIHAGGFYSADCKSGNRRLHYYLRTKEGEHPSGNQFQYENRGRSLEENFHHPFTPIELDKSGLFHLVVQDVQY